jgi:hypothetical protein
MSLIERAIGRLNNPDKANPEDGNTKLGPATTSPSGPVTESRPKATAIEALSERLERQSLMPTQQPATRATAMPSAPSAHPAPTTPGVPSSPTEPLRIHLESLRARGMVTPDGRQTRISEATANVSWSPLLSLGKAKAFAPSIWR